MRAMTPERSASVVDLVRPDLERAPRRSVEIECALGRTLVPGVFEQLGHRLGGEGVTVAADHEGIGPAVAIDDRAVLVAQDDALGERVEGAAQPDGVRARFGDRLGGAAGDLLQVGERDFDVVLVLWGIEAQSGAERREPLGDGTPARAAAEEGGHQSDNYAGSDRNCDEDDFLRLAEIDFPRRTQQHTPNMAGLNRWGEPLCRA